MKNNRFTGEHSKVMINFDYVIFAESQGYAGSDVLVRFRDGYHLNLTGETARMFINEWNKRDA